MPLALTRRAPVTHCAVTHGPLPAVGGGSVQPAMVYGADWPTAIWPPTFTRGSVTLGWACPVWLHSTVAPWWSR